MKDKQCEGESDDLSVDSKAKSKESVEVELDVKKEIDKVVEVIKNLRETAVKMKGAEVKVKNWSLLASYNEGEGIVDFKMNISVKPEKM